MKNEKTLAQVAVGDTFKIGDMTFVKFDEKDGEAAVILEKIAFKSSFGDNNNYTESDVKNKLERDILPQIEKNVGAENVIEHEVDLKALDGSDEYGKIRCRISLPTLDFLRKHPDIYKKIFNDYWCWLVTPWSTPKYDDSVWNVCVSPRGNFFNIFCNDCCGVRPFLILKSNIFVS